MISWRNGKDLRERWEDCGSAKTEQKSSLASLMSKLPPRTRLEDKPVMLSGRPGSSKDGLGGNRKVAFGCFLHFQGWQSKLSVVHLTRVRICAAKETDLVMVTLCGKKHTLNCTKYRFYHLMKGADRHGCLTPHSEDHCDEDYGNRLAHLILRIMMMFHWTKKLPPHRYVIYVVHHKKCSSGADGDDQKSWWRSIWRKTHLKLPSMIKTILKSTINTGHSGCCGKVSTKKKEKILILPEMVNHIKLLNNIKLKNNIKMVNNIRLNQQYKFYIYWTYTFK